MDREELRSLAQENFSWARQVRQALHRIPEPGFEEWKTQKLICDTLDELGIPYQTERTWVVGLLEGAHPGKTVGLRADIDALPVTEPEGCPFGSEHPGYMHACGHDVHTAIQLGCARMLAGVKEKLHGNVKLFFQPAEETDGGAKPMVEAGVMKNPDVDVTYGLHLQSRLPLGTIETRPGTLNASTDDVRITICGRSGHAAYPENSVDALVMTGQILTALQTLVSRNVSPLVPAVLSFGMIEGGKAANIICDRVTLRGTLRTADRPLREFLQRRIQETAQGIALAMGGSAEVEIEEGYAPLVNDPAQAHKVLKTARYLFGEEHVIEKDAPSMGGEDFSYFIEEKPGAFYHIGCTLPENLPAPALHSPLFCPDERCIMDGMMMQTALVLSEIGEN